MIDTIRKPRARKSYEARTGMNRRGVEVLVAAIFTKPETVQDEDGNVMRVWDNSETYTHADIAGVLANRVAVTMNEMLGVVPPRAVKYSCSKGWLVANASNTLFRVTLKGAIDLDLPMNFKGVHNNRRIPFAPAPIKDKK